MRGTLDQDKICKTLELRKQWRDQVRQRWPGMNTIMRSDNIHADDVNRVLLFADFLSKCSSDYKMVISVSYAWIYTNDLELIKKITEQHYLSDFKLTQAEIVRPKNCVQLRNPQHQYRSYFRSCRLTTDQKQHLCRYFDNQQDLRLSSGLKDWLESHYGRSQDYYFVDHNHQHFVTMLTLIVPNLIRKTLPIIAK